MGADLGGRDALLAKLESRKAAMGPALYATMAREMAKTADYARANKLSGQVLKNRTGNLRNAVSSSATVDGEVVSGRIFVGAQAPYGAIHEFGGTTSPHVIEAKGGGMLRFMMDGKVMFRRKVNHPGSKIPARPFLRPSLEERREDIMEALRRTVVRVLEG